MHYRIPGAVQGAFGSQGGTITMPLEVQNLGISVETDTRLINVVSAMLSARTLTAGEIILRAAIPSGSSKPTTNITPNVAGELYLQIDTDRVVQWVSTGLTDLDWKAYSGSGIQQTFTPNQAPDYIGQLWFSGSIDTSGGFSLSSIHIGVDPNGAADTSSWHQLY